MAKSLLWNNYLTPRDASENGASLDKTLQMKSYKRPETEIVLQAYSDCFMQEDGNEGSNWRVVDEDGNPIDGFANEMEFDEFASGKNSLWED